MGKVEGPRHGSMQFWPRSRAKRMYSSIRSFPVIQDAKPVGFAGYKVGMTHVSFTDNRKNTQTKGDLVTWPVTVVEVPPMTIIGARFYKKAYQGIQALTEVRASKLDKELSRKITVPKKANQNYPAEFDEVRLIVATNPRETAIGKKKPEIFEMAVGGSKDEQLAYIKENLGKNIEAKDIFKEGELIDSHSVTKGKGFQGATKKFGIGLRAKKSEKGQRGPGSLGGWKGHAHFMYRNPASGKMGFHNRTEYNKLVMKLGDSPQDVNVKGGFLRYGNLKSSYLLVKGSLGGASKRLIIFNKAIRPNKKLAMKEMPLIEYISTASKQGK